MLRGDAAGVRKVWPKLIAACGRQPLLYVALARGGNPQRIVASRGLQACSAACWPTCRGWACLRETVQLIDTIQEMETNHPVGPGAITEFDQMFKIGCRAIVRCLVAAAEGWPAPGDNRPGDDGELIAFLEQTTEALLRSWLIHSRGVRLSVLETVTSETRWHELKQFIEHYGERPVHPAVHEPRQPPRHPAPGRRCLLQRPDAKSPTRRSTSACWPSLGDQHCAAKRPSAG